MSALELRRQLLHLAYGPLLIALHQQGLLGHAGFLLLLGGGISFSYWVKRQQEKSLLRRLTAFFERKHHLESLPGKGILFFTLGAYLCLSLFDAPIAYAGIMVLSVGDAVSNVVGSRIGRIRTPLNPEKCIEGNLAGIVAAIPAVYFFFPHWAGAGAAAAVGMFLEIPRISLAGIDIDDNLIIPLGASFTVALFA